MGISELIFCTAILAIAKFRLGLGIEMLRTLAFVVIVFGNPATAYPNREDFAKVPVFKRLRIA